jgi:hypothetical protein
MNDKGVLEESDKDHRKQPVFNTEFFRSDRAIGNESVNAIIHPSINCPTVAPPNDG